MMSVIAFGASSAAFVPPATMQPLTRTTAAADVTMMARNPPKASPTKPVVTKGAVPLSPGSNYPTTKNIQTERKDMQSQSKKNMQQAEAKRKALISGGAFELA